jgi:dCMP deaminase
MGRLRKSCFGSKWQTRISKDGYFMEVAELASKRSTCIRRQVGAVLVKDGHIISTGYNGAPSGIEHCTNESCLRRNVESGTHHELCMAVHAEQNCIIQAALHGINTKDSILYTTEVPCAICAKMLINAGIKKIYAATRYNDKLSERLLKESGIETEIILYDVERVI